MHRKADYQPKHHKLGFWDKVRRLRVHVQNGQISRTQAFWMIWE